MKTWNILWTLFSEIDFLTMLKKKKTKLFWRSHTSYYLVLTNSEYGKSDSLDVVSLECTGSESFLHQCLRVRADQCSVMAGVQCMGKTIF